MNVKDVLVTARDLISDEKRWTQKYFARKSDGTKVEADHPDATCFCSIGAIFKVCPIVDDWADSVVIDAEDKLRGLISCEVAKFNDSHTHAEVLALFDRAIASCE